MKEIIFGIPRQGISAGVPGRPGRSGHGGGGPGAGAPGVENRGSGALRRMAPRGFGFNILFYNA